MTNSLYKLNKDFQTAIEQGFTVDEETGEIIDFSTAEIEKLEMDYMEKVGNCIAVYKNWDAMEKAMQAAIKDMQARKKVIANRKKKFAKYIGDNCPHKVDTPIGSVSHRSSKQVIVTDIDKLPEEYKRVKTTVDADKMAIKRAIDSGEHIDGAYIIINQNVQIR